jgi:hypothetical protein
MMNERLLDNSCYIIEVICKIYIWTPSAVTFTLQHVLFSSNECKRLISRNIFTVSLHHTIEMFELCSDGVS